MKKNKGCKTCGWFSHRNNACWHDKNVIPYEGTTDRHEYTLKNWHLHEKWNKKNRCRKYVYGYNKTTSQRS